MNVTEPELQDPALVGEVDLARAAAQEEAGDEQVGGHVGTHVEGGTAVTHLFEAAKPGYHGWRWAVTVASAGPDTDVTVSEVVLLPGPAALVAPDWVPWEHRVQAGDLGVGDLLPTSPDDPRLVPAYLESDDPAVEEVAHEAGLGRVRVLDRLARLDVASRWQHGEFGPRSDMARSAPAHCGTCGFYLPLAGSLRVAFGTCGNEISPADGHVVHVEYGCGAHSEAEVEQVSPVLVANLIYDDALLEVVPLDSPADAPVDASVDASVDAETTATEVAPAEPPVAVETLDTEAAAPAVPEPAVETADVEASPAAEASAAATEPEAPAAATEVPAVDTPEAEATATVAEATVTETPEADTSTATAEGSAVASETLDAAGVAEGDLPGEIAPPRELFAPSISATAADHLLTPSPEAERTAAAEEPTDVAEPEAPHTGFVVASSGETTALTDETPPAMDDAPTESPVDSTNAAEPSEATSTSEAPVEPEDSAGAAEPAAISTGDTSGESATGEYDSTSDMPVEPVTDLSTSEAPAEPESGAGTTPTEPSATDVGTSDTAVAEVSASEAPVEPDGGAGTPEPSAAADSTGESATGGHDSTSDVPVEPVADLGASEAPAEPESDAGAAEPAAVSTGDSPGESAAGGHDSTSEPGEPPAPPAAEPVAPLEPVVTAETSIAGAAAPATLTPWIRPEGVAKQGEQDSATESGQQPGLFDDGAGQGEQEDTPPADGRRTEGD